MFIRHSFQNSSLVFTEKKELLSPILCGVCFLSALTFAPLSVCMCCSESGSSMNYVFK